VNASDGSIEYGIRAKDGVERKMQPFLIDNYKLSHWLNARKLTLPMAAERADLDPALVAELVKGRRAELPLDEAGRLAQVLNVSVGHLAGGADRLPDVIHHTREQVEATRRAVNRGGIHFYNYYTLPSPNGYISPVLIDILCPSDRLPIQNNGHLEPAITINLGPGHINGLWGHELNDDTWHPFYANDTAKESWILGDSYLEPPYCPHTYARHGDEPTQILSYTIRSNLEPFLAASNGWSDQAYDNFLAGLADRPFGATVLRTFMKRHAYHTASLAARAGIGDNRLAVFLDGDEDALEVAEMQDLGRLLGFDYRMLLPVVRNHDAVGKSWCSIKQSIRSIRAYESYTVASMSASAQCANLMGLFIKVSNPGPLGEPDLMDHSSCHFLVTGGVMTFVWQDANGERREQVLGDRDALWVGSFVRHGFYGAGSLIKMGNGEGSSYLDYFEMSNTYEAAQALRRGRKDTTSWPPVSG
jgi:2-hydroxyethylphosphonate dioxygenase